MALSRKLLVITAAAKHDLADAARRLDRFMTDLDEGRFPEERLTLTELRRRSTSLRHKGD